MAEDTYFSARNKAEFVARSPEKDLLVSHLEMLKQSQTAATGLAAFLHTTSPTSPHLLLWMSGHRHVMYNVNIVHCQWHEQGKHISGLQKCLLIMKIQSKSIGESKGENLII